MIRNIRILGAALGGIVGLALATSLGGVFDRGGPYYGFFLAAWVVAWIVVGLGNGCRWRPRSGWGSGWSA